MVKASENIEKDRFYRVVTKRREILDYNTLQLVHCVRHVFSNKSNFSLAVTLCNNYPEFRENKDVWTIGQN